MNRDEEVDELSLCPLCNDNNLCGNLSGNGSSDDCWCMVPNAEFSEALMAAIPPDKKSRVCVCKKCMTLFQK